MNRTHKDAERGLPDPELWEAPRRISERDLTTDWGVAHARPPVEDGEEEG